MLLTGDLLKSGNKIYIFLFFLLLVCLLSENEQDTLEMEKHQPHIKT